MSFWYVSLLIRCSVVPVINQEEAFWYVKKISTNRKKALIKDTRRNRVDVHRDQSTTPTYNNRRGGGGQREGTRKCPAPRPDGGNIWEGLLPCMRKKIGGGSWARNRRGHAGVGYFGGGARRASDEDTTQGAERRCTDDSEQRRRSAEEGTAAARTKEQVVFFFLKVCFIEQV